MKVFTGRLLLALFPGCPFREQRFGAESVDLAGNSRQVRAGESVLRAGQIGVDESRAQEITAYLRPNPNLAVSVDGHSDHAFAGSLEAALGRY